MSNSRALENPADLSKWDLFLDGNRIARVSNEERVRQSIRERLQTFLGEWFLDVEVGVPWFQRIFVKPANIPLTESLIKQTILSTPDVTELVVFEFEADVKSRVIKVLDFVVNTKYGELEVTL